jgi:thiamine pyrophosphate-dependent acetolactate synthase large subunit-like protein
VGFGTLGWALPAAIGAAFTGARGPFVALAGDYGFQYTAPELATAVEQGLPLVVLLWNNDALGQIRDDMRRRQVTPVGTSLRNPDFRALARAMGAEALTVDRLDDVADAVREAAARRAPVLVELRERAIAASAGLPTEV